MDLILQEGSILQHGQSLHSPVVPGETMQKGGGGEKKRKLKIKMTKLKMAFCTHPVVASHGIRGPLNAWQSKEYHRAKRLALTV
jgi:hypothetical protein